MGFIGCPLNTTNTRLNDTIEASVKLLQAPVELQEDNSRGDGSSPKKKLKQMRSIDQLEEAAKGAYFRWFRYQPNKKYFSPSFWERERLMEIVSPENTETLFLSTFFTSRQDQRMEPVRILLQEDELKHMEDYFELLSSAGGTIAPPIRESILGKYSTDRGTIHLFDSTDPETYRIEHFFTILLSTTFTPGSFDFHSTDGGVPFQVFINHELGRELSRPVLVLTKQEFIFNFQFLELLLNSYTRRTLNRMLVHTCSKGMRCNYPINLSPPTLRRAEERGKKPTIKGIALELAEKYKDMESSQVIQAQQAMLPI